MAPVKRSSLSIPTALFLLGLIIILELSSAYLFNLIFPQGSESLALWTTGLLRLAYLGLILVVIQRKGLGFGAIGITPGKWKQSIGRGLILSLCFGGVVFSLWGVGLLFHFNLFRLLFSPQTESATVFELVSLFLIGGILSPMAEDCLFTGCLYNALATKIPIILSALGTALVFALLHGFPPFPFPQFIGGLLFTLAFEYSKNLLTPITIHIIANSVLFSIQFCPWLKGLLLR